MKRVLLVIAALLSLTVLLTACKKDGDTLSTTTSTATSAAAEPTATPEPTLPPYEANVLTGEPKDADYPEGQRITAVMVNNIVAACPRRTSCLKSRSRAASPALCLSLPIIRRSARSAPSAPAVTSSSA